MPSEMDEKCCLAAKKKPTPQPIPELAELGKHCSVTERRAEKAERELIRIRLLRYMSQRIGEEMDAFITGVESFGMFCQGVEIPAEGLIHLSAMADDFYVFDQATRTLTGSRTKREFRLGDRTRVVVAAVDVDRRQLDLRLVAGSSPTSSRTPRSSGEKSHRSPKHGPRNAAAVDHSERNGKGKSRPKPKRRRK